MTLRFCLGAIEYQLYNMASSICYTSSDFQILRALKRQTQPQTTQLTTKQLLSTNVISNVTSKTNVTFQWATLLVSLYIVRNFL